MTGESYRSAPLRTAGGRRFPRRAERRGALRYAAAASAKRPGGRGRAQHGFYSGQPLLFKGRDFPLTDIVPAV